MYFLHVFIYAFIYYWVNFGLLQIQILRRSNSVIVQSAWSTSEIERGISLLSSASSVDSITDYNGSIVFWHGYDAITALGIYFRFC